MRTPKEIATALERINKNDFETLGGITNALAIISIAAKFIRKELIDDQNKDGE